ncbi:MAG: STAS/SEC14 domain-containing protein [Gammaproteobacteria bacterium]|nr:STAS/SEC14 domain-containing protein [Gammaproteobacteria bacterium]
MLKHDLLLDKGVLVLSPQGPLEQADFEALAKVVDPYIESHGTLHGLMIYTESFPGWDNFAGLVSHMKFVKDHQQHINKVAAVTDSGFLSILPGITDHFVKAEVRHFDFEDKEKAMEWLTGSL